MLVAVDATVTALDVETNDFAELVTKTEVGVPALAEVLERRSLEVLPIVPNAAVIAGQVTVVDGETSSAWMYQYLSVGLDCFLPSFLPSSWAYMLKGRIAMTISIMSFEIVKCFFIM